jgi:IgGFc binding protein
MKQFLKTLISFAILTYCSIPLFSQKDTEFWFVAPNILENLNQQYDRPTAFRFSCYDQAATVTISQPANPSYPPQVISLPPNSTTNLDFPPFFDFIENFPPNTVLNKGFSIKSTAPISVYYEVIGGCKCNPEIFSLKGRNALGTKFYVPFQRLLNNASPMGRDAAFDIVATEANTEVVITPTKNIVGHAANVPFTITLQKGQTYSGQASSILAIDRPTGTKVESNKPIAITMKDDLLDAGPVYGGFCRDMIGDQIVPVHKTGTKYVISKGYLTGGEVGYVVATQDGTVVKRDGVTIGIINAGEDKAIVVEDHHFIETSKPAYLLQLTGIGCETSGEVLPSLDCSGSEQIRFVRSTDESFYMFLITRNGNQDAFILNGNTFSISAASFSVVPGSNGEWVTAVLPFNNSIVPAEQSSEIRNTEGLFHLGILNGSPSVTGSRFGFFSDFGNTITVTDTIKFCIGQCPRQRRG